MLYIVGGNRIGITCRENKKPHFLFNGQGKASLLCSFKCVRLENMKYSPRHCASLAGAAAINLGKSPLTFMFPHRGLHGPSSLPLPASQTTTTKNKKPLNHTSNPQAQRCTLLACLVGQGYHCEVKGRDQKEGGRRWNQSSINH